MLTAVGFGNSKNILYALVNLGISVGLFLYRYGLETLMSNGIYVGGLTVALAFVILGKPMCKIFHDNFYAENEED